MSSRAFILLLVVAETQLAQVVTAAMTRLATPAASHLGRLALSSGDSRVAGDPGHQAVQAMQAGNYSAAKEILEAALKQSPRDARLWTLAGLNLVRLGESPEALVSFHRALQISPDYYPALEGAVELELQAASPHAVETLQRMRTLHPEDVTVLQELGFLLMKQKAPAQALPVFERLATLQPSNEKVSLDLGAVQFLTGHYADVIATLRPLVSAKTSDTAALELLAQAYSLTSQTDKAVSLVQSAIQQNRASAKLYLDYADICLAHGCFQTGIQVVTEGLQRLPDSAPLYVARGVLYSEVGDYDKGESDFQRAEQLDPDVEDGSFAKGLAELQRNDVSQAEVTVRARLRSQPRDPHLQYLLAEILTRKGAAPGTPEFQEALTAARRSVELKPDLAPARDLLGRLYVENGDIEKGIDQSRIALRLNPADQKALYHLIAALRKAHRTEELPSLMKRMVQLREQNGTQQAIEHNYALVERSKSTAGTAAQP